MVRASVNRLPVLDERGRLVGLVARSDVVRWLSGRPTTRRGRLQPSGPRSRRDRSAAPFADI
jgi:CBS domain-containing protein